MFKSGIVVPGTYVVIESVEHGLFRVVRCPTSEAPKQEEQQEPQQQQQRGKQGQGQRGGRGGKRGGAAGLQGVGRGGTGTKKDDDVVKLGRHRDVPLHPLKGVPYGSLFVLNDELGTLELVADGSDPRTDIVDEANLEQRVFDDGDEEDDKQAGDTSSTTTEDASTEIQGGGGGKKSKPSRNADSERILRQNATDAAIEGTPDGLTIQPIQNEQIREMRAQGASTRDVIKKIAQSSKTFEQRTEFGQVKYLKKKQMKYVVVLTVTPLTAISLCRVFFMKKPLRICNMPWDGLAQVLARANIRVGSRPLVVDSTGGVVLGAVVERMLPSVLPRSERPPPMSKAEQRARYDQAMITIEAAKAAGGEIPQLSDLVPSLRSSADVGDPDAASDPYLGGRVLCFHNKAQQDLEVFKLLNFPWYVQFELVVKTGFHEIPALEMLAKAETKLAAQPQGDLTPEETCLLSGNVPGLNSTRLQSLRVSACGADSFICVTSYDPWSVIRLAWPWVRLGAPFVIYATSTTPLLELADVFKATKVALDVEMFEISLREHQVLENRTHPEMRMLGASSFILVGHKATEMPSDLVRHLTIADLATSRARATDESYHSLRAKQLAHRQQQKEKHWNTKRVNESDETSSQPAQKRARQEEE